MDAKRARQLLNEELVRLETARGQIEADLEEQTGEGTGELADYDQHEADDGTELAGVEQGLGLRSDLDQRLEEVRGAIGRLDAGSYGICERCGRPIGDDRLEAVPATRYCREDQAAERTGTGRVT